MTDFLSLDNVAKWTYIRLPLDKQKGLDVWRAYVWANKRWLYVLSDECRINGVCIAEPDDEVLDVRWIITDNTPTFFTFITLIQKEFPLVRTLIYERKGRKKLVNLNTLMKTYGKRLL